MALCMYVYVQGWGWEHLYLAAMRFMNVVRAGKDGRAVGTLDSSNDMSEYTLTSCTNTNTRTRAHMITLALNGMSDSPQW